MVAKLIHARSAAPSQAVRRRRVRGPAGEPPAERTVRARAGRVHRRRPREAGAVRGGARRHRSSSTRSARSAPPRRSSCCACSTRPRFRRVGATTEIRVDVRVLAATNRDLAAMVRQGLFREDLYYRLSTISLTLPPLREREGDVEVLAAQFVARLNERFGSRKRLGPGALEALRRHDWPGNVRELLHVIEAAMIVSDEAEIGAAHLPPSIRSGPAGATGRGGGSRDRAGKRRPAFRRADARTAGAQPHRGGVARDGRPPRASRADARHQRAEPVQEAERVRAGRVGGSARGTAPPHGPYSSRRP